MIASDGIEQSNGSSTFTVIQNSPPSQPEIFLGEYNRVDNDLFCEISVPSTDPDRDLINYV